MIRPPSPHRSGKWSLPLRWGEGLGERGIDRERSKTLAESIGRKMGAGK